MIDRRLSPRIACNLPADYQGKSTNAQMGRITNIGTAGVCLATQRMILPVGANLLLRFKLPLSKRSVQAGGTVKWAAQWTAGVELIHMNIQTQDEIWRYYARESARQRAHELGPPEPLVPGPDPGIMHETVLDAWRRLIHESQ